MLLFMHINEEELETLNRAAEDINTMELLLGEARVKFRAAMKDATRKLNELGVKLGSSVEKSRVYYDVREKAKELQQETQAAAVKFERANSHLATAKEMVELAEQEALKEGLVFDTNWQEMLNQATMKVNEAEKDRLESEEMHMATASRYEAAEKEVKRLQRSLKRNINKSKPYFEANNEFKLVLEALKSKVDVLTEQVSLAKGKYKAALQNLEIISSNIHHQRHQTPPEQRESGVGAESTFIESKDGPDSPLSSPHISLKGLGFQEVMEECCPLEKDYEGQNLLLRARRNPCRSISVPSEGDETNSEIDPLSIMSRTLSTDHLDNLSDTSSFVSIEAILDQDRLDTDSILSEEGLECTFERGHRW
ncbi:hypothetical protein BSL78_13681 [Apostichopus japonicus]|uniref:SH3 domain-binding protein 5-like n=1 Tax=Stichopus japonicus TaxID=307972 RepID=A0A2G8KN71_STIJA|nr:hypothetical protein BSL78_13681 [Apostichopus japonicus]